MKFSIITAVYNRRESVRQAIESVRAQTHSDVEHIVVDGASTDGTTELLRAQADSTTVLISEPDHGIYDALNKGLKAATGDVVGVMHSDDFFADAAVLADVANAFHDPAVDAVYGDLDYVKQSNTNQVVRHWRSGEFSGASLGRGWMPPHPALFLRRRVIERHGAYDTSYRIAADYDAILRYFGDPDLKVKYLPRVLVKMALGGESNQSLAKVWQKSLEDYRALRRNEVGGLPTLVWKNVSKLRQFVIRA